ncbi:hypothetical protein EMPS_03041 [Entomortierella parvispora]|uniref:Rap-GAP domain-containing protein n=1 Tax=Entomortierella parvispora TaxID=205924 RepID=A0A9P3LU17_9FUNG|nr:hypothetical protein EMPS_03041 [Entomortierella parvispora]
MAAAPSGTPPTTRPQSGPHTIFKDTMNTFSVTSEPPQPGLPTLLVSKTQYPSLLLTSDLPETVSEEHSQAPASLSSPISSTTMTTNTTPTTAMATIECDRTLTALCSPLQCPPSSPSPSSEHLKAAAPNSLPSSTTNSANPSTAATATATTTAQPAKSAALTIDSTPSTSSSPLQKSSNKTFAFFGSLSPKSSRQKIKGLTSRKNSRAPSPSPTRGPQPTAGSPAIRVQSEESMSNSSSFGKTSIDLQDPLDNRNQQGKDKSPRKKFKEKDGHHPHFGQRLSMAIGLSSLGVSGGSKSPLRDKDKDSSLQQIERGRQMSVDSLSTIDTAHRRPSTDGSIDLSGFIKERRSSVISHFLIRPRVSNSSEGPSPKSSSCETPINIKEDTTGNSRSEAALSHSTSSPYSDASATTSSASAESGHGADQDEHESHFSARRLIWRQKNHGRGRVCTSGEKSSSDIGQASALDGPYSSRHPQSIADIMESSRELHPHHPHHPHHPSDMERLELYHQLGLQEVQHSSLTGEDSANVVMQQLYGDPTSVARSGASSLAISGKQHDIDRETAIETLTTTDKDMPSPPSTAVVAACDQRPSSKRLGRFARFRFPSISISGIHKSHKHVGHTLTALDVKKDSLLSTPSQVQKSTPAPPTPAKHPPPYPPLIHASGSSSTFASSVNTAATTHLGASTGSSSNSSVSSYSAGKKQITRQSLAAFLDGHAHHPHHSSTSSTLAPTLSTGSMGSCSTAPRTSSDSQGSNHQLQNLKFSSHLHHPRGNSGSGAYKGLFGSERFTSSTTSNATHGNLPEFGPSLQEAQDHRGGFRTGLLRRTSRRTVSASHISSKDVFGTGTSSTQGSHMGTESCHCGPDARERTCNLTVVQGPFPKLFARDEYLGAESRKGSEELICPRGEKSVGRYLFGSELKQMTFGDQDSGLQMLDTHTNGNNGSKDSHSDVEKTPTATAGETVVVDPSPNPSASTSEETATSHCGSTPLAPALLPSNEDSLLAKSDVRITTRDGGLRRISDPMLRKMASALSERHSTAQRTLSASSIAPTDHSTKSVVRSDCTNLSTITNQGNGAPNMKNVLKPTSPVSAAAFTASSPNSMPNKKKEHGRLTVTAVKSRSSSPAPPSPLGMSVSGSSSLPAGPFSSVYTSNASSSLKSKFSIPGITSHGHYHHVPFSSYLPRRPSISHTVFSSAHTPASNAAIAAAATAASAASASSSSRSPNMLHLEPRSATADYSCSGIHYKRQRSMSLQDADLLTADQFIALMPGSNGHKSGEETPPKRRFSSEETLQENPWCLRPKTLPIPDPIVTLRAHQESLKSNSDLILKLLATVNCPFAPIHHQQTITNSDSTLSSAKTLEASGSEFTLDGSGNDIGDDLNNKDGIQDMSGPQILILVQEVEDNGESESDDRSTKDSESDQLMEDTNDATPTTNILATDHAPENEQQDSATYLRLEDMDPKQNLIETTGGHLEEIEHTVDQMVEILSKHISTNQFSKLISETNDMCFRSQEVFQFEMERRRKWRIEAGLDQQEEQPSPDNLEQALQTEKESVAAEAKHVGESNDDTGGSDAESTLLSLEEALKQVMADDGRAERGRSQRYVVKNKDSKDRNSQHRDMDGTRKQKYRYRAPPGSPFPYVRNSLDAGLQVPLSSEMLEEHQNNLKDYVRMVLEMAEISITEFIRVYNSMFIVPTSRYRIEGCNDLKKIERALRSEPNSQHSHPCHFNVSKTFPLPSQSATRGEDSSTSQPSLMSRVSILQDAQLFASPTTTPTLDKVTEADIAAAESVPPTITMSTLASNLTQAMNPAHFSDTGSLSFSSSTCSPLSPVPHGPNLGDLPADSSSTPSSSSGPYFNGQPMARVKSLPESKDEWAAFQKRKVNTSSSTGIGTVSPDVDSSTQARQQQRSESCGSVMTPNLSMLGEYSQEHMGHEAYYYRNWFLGKEHRTFVGQVEGLGTVIISIIKDMVVPTESRLNHSRRTNTGPFAAYPSASSISPSAGLSMGLLSHNSHSAPGLVSRPELVHSTQSFYYPRGPGFYNGQGTHNGVPPSSRTSTEAMRVILASSNAAASGSGGDNHPSISHPLIGPGYSHHGATSSLSSTHTSKSHSALHSSGDSQQMPHHTPHIHHHPHSYPQLQQQNLHQPGQPIQQSNGTSGPTAPSITPARWQYRCILRQKDVDSIRITLPEPEPSSPLNNLTRRAGKPQWKAILQSIHPAITQQVASKLKKVQNNQHFEKELAKFDETMLRFNYKFGVLLVLPGQVKEEDWFSNQMKDSERFCEFLESGALGQKVALKGFERFSGGLDTRSNSEDSSYYDTWGDDGSFEIMYHVSTLLPFNTVDRQQIQRKRHIGNDIVCIVFVDGDQPFYPSAIKSQFLHIFVVIHPILLPDGKTGYSAAIACDEQVPEFGPPLPHHDQPLIFRNAQELRAFLLCKMINGENAAYKAPRLIKPHQRARSGLLENLVAKANTLAKEKDKDKDKNNATKSTKPYKIMDHHSALDSTTGVDVVPHSTSAPSEHRYYRESPGYDQQHVHPFQYQQPPQQHQQHQQHPHQQHPHSHQQHQQYPHQQHPHQQHPHQQQQHQQHPHPHPYPHQQHQHQQHSHQQHYQYQYPQPQPQPDTQHQQPALQVQTHIKSPIQNSYSKQYPAAPYQPQPHSRPIPGPTAPVILSPTARFEARTKKSSETQRSVFSVNIDELDVQACGMRSIL